MQAPFDIAADLDTPVSAFLKLAPLPQRADLMKKASLGLSMHKEGHRQGDMDKLLVSLRFLDELKAEIAPWAYDFNRTDTH